MTKTLAFQRFFYKDITVYVKVRNHLFLLSSILNLVEGDLWKEDFHKAPRPGQQDSRGVRFRRA